MGNPVPQRRDVLLGFDADAFRQLQPVPQTRRRVGRYRAIPKAGALRERRLGWPDDDALFVDPHSARDVHDAKHLVDDVRLVDQRRVLRFGGLDPRSGSFGPARVQGDGDDLESGRMELSPQFLPHGQV